MKKDTIDRETIANWKRALKHVEIREKKKSFFYPILLVFGGVFLLLLLFLPWIEWFITLMVVLYIFEPFIFVCICTITGINLLLGYRILGRLLDF